MTLESTSSGGYELIYSGYVPRIYNLYNEGIDIDTIYNLDSVSESESIMNIINFQYPFLRSLSNSSRKKITFENYPLRVICKF